MAEVEEILIRNSRLKNGLYSFGSLLFVAGIIWMLNLDLPISLPRLIDQINAHEKGWLLASGIPLFGGTLLMSLWRLFDRRVQIHMKKDHVFLRDTRIFSRSRGMHTVPWSHIDEFHFYGSRFLKLITIKLSPSYQPHAGLKPTLLDKLRSKISGNDLGLIASHYDLSPREIYNSLKDFHDRATQKAAL